eukprot:11253728-Ditylum_brightwellii.AAC.1
MELCSGPVYCQLAINIHVHKWQQAVAPLCQNNQNVSRLMRDPPIMAATHIATLGTAITIEISTMVIQIAILSSWIRIMRGS